MRAFVYTKKGYIEEKELKDVNLSISGEAAEEDRYACVLKPIFVSPCSSDAHTVYAGDGPRRPDLILGHEGIAEVLEAGDRVRDFKKGDLVAVSAVMPEPGDIYGHAGRPFSAAKLGRNIDGMWSERFKVPMADANLAHIPEGLSMESALMAVDMMATGATAAEEAEITEGISVLVIGSGAVGLMAAMSAARMGAWRIYMIGSDRNAASIEAARQFGVDAYISYKDGRLIFADDEAKRLYRVWALDSSLHKDPRANYTGNPATETMFAITGGEGVDAALICGDGNKALIQASDLIKYGGGRAVNVSYMEGSGTVKLPIFSLGRGMSGKSFKFCLSRGGRKWTERMLKTAAELEKKDALSAPGILVTHHLKGFDKIPEGLKMMHERPDGLIKIMVETGL